MYLDIKTWFGITTLLLTVVGYFPYFRDIFAGKTKPHLYSWLVWGVFGIIIFVTQLRGNAGAGSWMMGFASVISLVIAGLSLTYGTKNITSTDHIFLGGAVISILTWFFVNNSIVSLILICIIDVAAFVPTIRKSWVSPYEESISFYGITAFRYGLSILALTTYTVNTVLFLLLWLSLNVSFMVFLTWRRRVMLPITH